MTQRHPHQRRWQDVHPLASWAEASCAHEARVLEDDRDGPELFEEHADALARKELSECPLAA